MPRQTVAYTNFTAGQLSPKLDGRTDLTKYYNGAKTLKNFTIQPHGGASRRPGTVFIHEVKDSSQEVRLIPFEFSTVQTYILEFGNEYIRFYKDKGIITESAVSISGITQANPAVVTATSHGYNNGDHVIITSVSGMVQVNGKTFTVANKTTNTFEIQDVDGNNVNSSSFTAYASGGSVYRIYEISSPYAAADLSNIKFAQSSDIMYLVHPNYAVRKLTRTGHTSWSLTEVEFNIPPFQPHNGEDTTITASHTAVGATSTFTASDITGINGNTGFKSTDVGRAIHFNDGHAIITSFTSTTVVAGLVKVALGSGTANTDFALGSFSTTTGHPSCVTFFEQRLVFAGTNEEPQALFFSKVNEYENFDDGYHTSVTDTSAMFYTIASNKVNTIRFLSSQRSLIIGTTGGEFVASAGASQPLSPTNVQIQRQTSYGCANIDAVQVSNVTMFLQRAKRKLRELTYSFDFDSYVAPDMTILSENVTESGIKELSYQQEPDSILWGARLDGRLIGLTYQRNEDVVGWHVHELGGSFGSDSFSHVENIATVPGDVNEDDLYLVVKRTVNGNTRRYIEYLTDYNFGTSITDAFFIDSGLTYSGSATTTVSGLDHLEGETVSILADGATHPDETVSSGSVTLDRSATKIHIGLPYTSLLQTMRIEAGAKEGVAQGQTKRIHDVTIRLLESVGVEIGSSLDNMERIPFRSSANPMDVAIPTFSGDKQVEFRGDFETDGYIYVRQTQPLPINIIGIYPTVTTNEG
tara:strand:- start:503 stop:2761 length:2259 start_codon:yes stop_codon:yes gene_type:complete